MSGTVAVAPANKKNDVGVRSIGEAGEVKHHLLVARDVFT